jgi:hypothetical protein
MSKPKGGKKGGRTADGQGGLFAKGADHKRPSGKKVTSKLPKGNKKGS